MNMISFLEVQTGGTGLGKHGYNLDISSVCCLLRAVRGRIAVFSLGTDY